MGFELLLPILERLGAGFVGDLPRSQLEARLRKGIPKAAARLEKDGITPQKLAGTDQEKRHLIRTALYWTLKGLVRSGTAADAIRDAYDDHVTEIVTPAVTAEMTAAALCEATMGALLDVLF